MKKCVCLCLMVAMLLSLCACGEEKEPMIEAVTTTATTTTGQVVTDATITSTSTASTRAPKPSASAPTWMSFVKYAVPDVLKPELRFFRTKVDVSELGEIVDVVTVGSSYTTYPCTRVWCLTADGKLYEVADKPFSTTGKHYRQVSCSYSLDSCLGERYVVSYFSNVMFVTTDGRFVGCNLSNQTESTLQFFEMPDFEWDEYYFSRDNRVMCRVDGEEMEIYNFPINETVLYVSQGKESLWDDTMIFEVRTNKGWYHLYRMTEEVDSGFADVPPAEKHTYETKKVDLDKSVSIYRTWSYDCMNFENRESKCALLTKEGVLYFNPACQYHSVDGWLTVEE